MAEPASSSSAANLRLFRLVLTLANSEHGYTREDLFSQLPEYAGMRQGAADTARAESNLARLFERDKQALRELGIVIETLTSPEHPDDNRLTRYRIARGDVMFDDSFTLTPLESSLLQSASLAIRGTGLDEVGRRALFKVMALGAGHEHRDTLPVNAHVVKDPAHKVLADAISRRVWVRFDYAKPGEAHTTSRHVAPLELLFEDGRWHLLGHDGDKNASRVFLLSRIQGAVKVLVRERVSDELFSGIPKMQAELRAFAQNNAARLSIAVHSAAFRTLVSRFGARVTSERDATAVVELPVLDNQLFAAELLRFGTAVTVLEPEALRATVRRTAQAIFQLAKSAPRILSGAEPLPPASKLRRDARAQLNVADRFALQMAITAHLQHSTDDLPVTDLAERFGVPSIEVHRLVNELYTMQFGPEGEYPIDIDLDAFESGRVVPLEVGAGAQHTLPKFTPVEAMLLTSVVSAQLPVLTGDTRVAAESLLQKMQSFSRSVATAENLSDVPPLVAELLSMIQTHSAARIVYENAQQRRSERVIKPLRLSENYGRWTLTADDTQSASVRHFRVDRIIRLETAQPRDPDPSLDASADSGFAQHEPYELVTVGVAREMVESFTPYGVEWNMQHGEWVIGTMVAFSAQSLLEFLTNLPGVAFVSDDSHLVRAAYKILRDHCLEDAP